MPCCWCAWRKRLATCAVAAPLPHPRGSGPSQAPSLWETEGHQSMQPRLGRGPAHWLVPPVGSRLLVESAIAGVQPTLPAGHAAWHAASKLLHMCAHGNNLAPRRWQGAEGALHGWVHCISWVHVAPSPCRTGCSTYTHNERRFKRPCRIRMCTQTTKAKIRDFKFGSRAAAPTARPCSQLWVSGAPRLLADSPRARDLRERHHQVVQLSRPPP